MKKTFFLVSIAFFAVFLQSCNYFSVATVQIDNPTSEVIEVGINDEVVSIAANDTLEKQLSKGTYTVSLSGENVGSFVIDSSKGGVLNPTRYDYIWGEAYYTTDEEAEYPLEDRIFELNGRKYFGPFLINNSLFIEKDWDYPLGVSFPDEINDLAIGTTETKSKLFYFDEFELEYENYHGYTEEDIENYFSGEDEDQVQIEGEALPVIEES